MDTKPPITTPPASKPPENPSEPVPNLPPERTSRLKRALSFLLEEWPLVALLALAAVTFSSVRLGQYLTWDDDHLILGNIHLTEPFLTAMKGLWLRPFEGDYAPLQHLSYWLEVKAFGFRPGAQLLVNLGLHLLNITLVYRFLRSQLDFPKATAVFAAGIFALHPLQVEAVAWISERKGLLCATFTLLALRSYFKNSLFYWAFYLAAGLSKAVAVFLPLGLLAFDLIFRERQSRRETFEKHSVPLAAMACFAMIRILVYVKAVGSEQLMQMGLPSNSASFLTSIHSSTLALGHYLFSAAWPLQLSAFYPQPDNIPFSELKIVAACLFLVSALWLSRRHPTRAMLLVLFLVPLLPVLDLFKKSRFVNDRYMYLPLFGLAGFVANLPGVRSWAEKNSKLALVAAFAMALSLAHLTKARVGIWRDSETFWQRATVDAPQDPATWAGLALQQLRTQQFAGAEQTLKKASELSIKSSAVHNYLGILYGDPGVPEFYRPQESMDNFKQSLALAKNLDQTLATRYYMALSLSLASDKAAALQLIAESLSLYEKEARGGTSDKIAQLFRKLDEKLRAETGGSP